jgi:hypothetical protein
MPRHKLTAQKKLGGVALRRVHVSWLDSEPEKVAWKDKFFQRLLNAANQREEMFAEPTQSAKATTGGAGNLGKEDDPVNHPHLTDVVGILTEDYIAENTDRRDLPAPGELARVFDRVLADKKDRIRVFLAPVDPPDWSYRVRKIVLGDPKRAHAAWLVRLKETRFVWPRDSPAGSLDEIAAAVKTLIDKPDGP